MSSSKKKSRSRVQGGWASASNKNFNANNLKRASDFSFNPTTKVVDKELLVHTYRDPGTYVLSETSNGISHVTLARQFIKPEECEWMIEQLANEIPWNQESIIFDGERKDQPRLCAWFGDNSYSYSGIQLKPFQFSPLLLSLKNLVSEKCNRQFNSVLANLYRNEKDSVEWHSDDEKELGSNPYIASLSFGATRTFEMRKKGEVNTNVRLPLDNGCLLMMEGATQSDWQHRVPKEYHDREMRINLTFRWLYNIDQ